MAVLLGNNYRLEAIATELWEGYGVDVDKDPRQRETGGIQKVVAITDDFEHVVGFEREEREVNAWLDWHGYSSTQDRSIFLSPPAKLCFANKYGRRNEKAL